MLRVIFAFIIAIVHLKGKCIVRGFGPFVAFRLWLVPFGDLLLKEVLEEALAMSDQSGLANRGEGQELSLLAHCNREDRRCSNLGKFQKLCCQACYNLSYIRFQRVLLGCPLLGCFRFMNHRWHFAHVQPFRRFPCQAAIAGTPQCSKSQK